MKSIKSMISIICIICIICMINMILAYSTYGAPSEFGNETTTTCWIGGDLGVANCTGNATFSNILGNLPWNNLYDYPVACSSGYALTQLDDSITCTQFAQYQFTNNHFNGSGNFTTSGWGMFNRVGIGITPSAKLELYDTASSNGLLKIHNSPSSGDCPTNMAYINKNGGFCIDQYEAHALNSNGSIATPPTSAGATDNLIAAGGKAGSAFNQTVWVYIDQTEARTACSNAGKHLCTDAEWLGAANLNGQVYNLPTDLAVSPYFCVTSTSTDCAGESPGSGSACKTGGCTDDEGCGNCVSSEGVYDQVGNVWEWTNETATTVSPESGWHYINTTDMTWALVSSADDGTYGKDGTYLLAGTNNRAVRRGGRWDTGHFAGPFCAYLNTGPAGTYSHIGFRCCSS